jgi:hypothetical protein
MTFIISAIMDYTVLLEAHTVTRLQPRRPFDCKQLSMASGCFRWLQLKDRSELYN